MAYHDDGAIILIQRLCDDGEMTEIDMVGWLVENEEMRLLDNESRVAEQTFLSFRERSDGALQKIARQ